ncbi:MAG TPA: hypothetical protein PKU96_05610 [bacterium]|nr:hypothetical protein [Myxococcales bacterium]OQA60956.1 MAG: hypothetical protein BWY40_00803 [bacterium ADurb.Bin270]HPW45829.1 hypothetical protein [bacterium]HQC50587.1 hypothetical protein [bacterium]HQG12791.1 hypothetical protein [bacterium]
MGFQVKNDVVSLSNQKFYDSVKPSGGSDDLTPKNEPPKDEYKCVTIGLAGSESFSMVCGPVGKSTPFSPNESQAEKELFCDIMTQAMEEGQDVPVSWIFACEEFLKEE